MGTANDRASGKRLRQAQYLANLIQARQLADPAERIIVLGDMNAYEFNDGFVDSLGTIAGTPAPDDQTLVPGDGGDLVDPDLVNLLTTLPAAERYSYVYDGQAQTLEHVLVNAAVVADTGARRLEHARINADWPEVIRGAAPDAIRLSDHDPVVLYLAPRDFATADLSVLKTAGSDPVVAGADLAWTITVSNAGPDPATGVSWSDPLPASTTFVSLSAPGGWSCTTPAPGAGGTVSCEIAAFGVGSATFTLVGRVAPDLATGTAIVNTATLAATTSTDPNPGNDSATATVTARSEADFQLTKTAAPEPVTAGGTLTYTLTVVNPGPSLLLAATLTDPPPPGHAADCLGAPGWTCTGAVTCTTRRCRSARTRSRSWCSSIRRSPGFGARERRDPHRVHPRSGSGRCRARGQLHGARSGRRHRHQVGRRQLPAGRGGHLHDRPDQQRSGQPARSRRRRAERRAAGAARAAHGDRRRRRGARRPAEPDGDLNSPLRPAPR